MFRELDLNLRDLKLLILLYIFFKQIKLYFTFDVVLFEPYILTLVWCPHQRHQTVVQCFQLFKNQIEF